MRYQEVLPMRRSELERLLDSTNDEAIGEALLNAAYYDPDWRWVQNQCLHFLDHEGSSVRWVAATCLGHIARVHGRMDAEIVLPRLAELKADRAIAPVVEDALDDIKFFLRYQ
jgi:hypothetical protein